MIVLHNKKSSDGVLTPISQNQTCFNMLSLQGSTYLKVDSKMTS